MATMMRRPDVLEYVAVVTTLLQYVFTVAPAQAFEARQQSGLVPATDDQFLRWSAHQATVAGDYLYIEGGIFSYMSSGKVQVEQASSVLAVDLANDWNNATLNITSTPKPDDYPKLGYGALWYHQSENLIYSSFSWVVPFGNFNTSPPLTLWAFRPDNTGGGTFDTIFNSDASIWTTSNLTRPYYALQASGPDNAFMLGGLDQARSFGLPGMVQFDLNTRAFTIWSSTSIGQPIHSGKMQFVPSFGQDGIFLAFGGQNVKQELTSFGMVPVFDPAAHLWYNQTTSGNTPKGRRDFCVAGIASNNDTYEIFLYGGLGGKFDNDDGKQWYDTPYDTIRLLT